MKNLRNNRTLQLVLVLLLGLFLGWLFFANRGVERDSVVTEEANETTWTCSMHPQIRQNEPGQCPICGMDLIPVAQSVSAGAEDYLFHTMSPEAVALANVQTTIVGASAPTGRESRLTGRVSVNEQNLASVSANFPGRLESMNVSFEGQSISRGQHVASIYSPELLTAQKELLEAAKFKVSNPALYNAAREKLRLWKISEAQINRIESNGEIQNTVGIFSDKSGIVTRINVVKGDFVDRGTRLFDLADLSNVWIVLDAYEADLSNFRTGDVITFSVPALPGREFTATIEFIDPVVRAATRTIAVRAVTQNPDLLLKPDMFVNAQISPRSVTNKGSAITVPRTAVLWTGKRSVVYVKVADTELPAFEMREVILGSRLGDSYAIDSGLVTGEEVVTNGAFSIDAAAQLSGRQSMMNRMADISKVPQPGAEAKAIPDYSAETPAAFREQVKQVLSNYLQVKDALVNDDAAAAKQASPRIPQAVRSVDMRLVQGQAHDLWMEQYNALIHHADEIAKTNNIEQQRENFIFLSTAMISTIEGFGYSGQPLYLQFCPMANNDKGAYWLSFDEEIMNPYFGASMLRCGEVRDTFPKVEDSKQPAQPQQQTQPPVHRH